MIAACGHEDILGYFAGTVCRPCADKGHAKATGKAASPDKERKGERHG